MSTKKRSTCPSPRATASGEVRHYGVIASDLEPLDKVVRALRAPGPTLHFVYEAGPVRVRHLPAPDETRARTASS